MPPQPTPVHPARHPYQQLGDLVEVQLGRCSARRVCGTLLLWGSAKMQVPVEERREQEQVQEQVQAQAQQQQQEQQQVQEEVQEQEQVQQQQQVQEQVQQRKQTELQDG